MDRVVIPLLLFFVGVVVYLILKEKRVFWESIKESLIFGAFAVVALACFWGSVFAWNVVKTTHIDHQGLVTSIGRLSALNRALQNENNKLKADNASLNNRPPKTVVLTKNVPVPIPTPPEKLMCRFGTYYTEPSLNIFKDSKINAFVVITCNARVESPFRVMVLFDKDFIHGSASATVVGSPVQGSAVVNINSSRVFGEDIVSPPLLPYQAVIVSAQSKDTSITAIKLTIGPPP